MAVYFNLGIDCGKSTDAADAVAAHFQGFKVSFPEVGDVECEVWRECREGYCFIGVWPRGLGYAIPSGSRHELLPYEAEIGEALYRRLSSVGGYRRAIFGGEAYDMLRSGMTQAELMDNDYVGMVYAEAEFPGPPPGRLVRPFRPGYLFVE